MHTTVFSQAIVGQANVTVEMPYSRVERTIAKVDALNEAGQGKKALKLLQPYIVDVALTAAKKAEVAVAKMPKRSKRDMALAIGAANPEMPRGDLIKKIQAELDITYANSRHYVCNVMKR